VRERNSLAAAGRKFGADCGIPQVGIKVVEQSDLLLFSEGRNIDAREVASAKRFEVVGEVTQEVDLLKC